jgi:hypothetical protein
VTPSLRQRSKQQADTTHIVFDRQSLHRWILVQVLLLLSARNMNIQINRTVFLSVLCGRKHDL